MAELVTIAEALETILGRARPLGSETVPLAEAAGRVLAETAHAVVDLPPFRSSAMDGYAVRAKDAPGPLRVVSRSTAGRPADVGLAPGEAIAVTTGAVVPDGADAVVPIERVDSQDNETIRVPADVATGDNVRGRGGDIAAGAAAVAAGTRLGASHIGALAAAGVTELVCARRPLVRLVPTGTELRSPGEPLAPGEIYESNGTMLAVLLGSAGALVEAAPPVRDDVAAHRVALAAGLGADVLVTSGGVSVGSHDFVREIERELGVHEVFWGVAMRPGKPLSFAVRNDTLVFGLPGNPVSSLVSAILFVRPAVLALQGAAQPGPPWLAGTLAAAVRRSPARDDLLRARGAPDESGIVRLAPVSGQESHMIVRTASADALVHVPRGEGALEEGAPVRYLRLD